MKWGQNEKVYQQSYMYNLNYFLTTHLQDHYMPVLKEEVTNIKMNK